MFPRFKRVYKIWLLTLFITISLLIVRIFQNDSLKTKSESVEKESSKIVIKETLPQPYHHTEDIRDPTLNYNVHIFYYPWWGNPEFDGGNYYHWNERYLPHWSQEITDRHPKGRHQPPKDIASNFYPVLGCYSSRNPEVVDQHMRWIRDSGVGTLAVSWYPPDKADDAGHPWDDLMPLLLDVAAKYQLKVAFHIEPYKPMSMENIRSNLQYILAKYGSHPAFYYHKFRQISKPLFYLYDSYLIKTPEWRRLLKPEGDLTIRATPLDSYMIGLLVKSPDKSNMASAGFDGFYTYFASKAFSHGANPTNWQSLQTFARRSGMLFVPSVGPGYIDTRVRPWNDANTQSRRGGAYYRTYFQKALEADVDLIAITSFNEWHEGTQIEPAKLSNETFREVGMRYMEYADKYLYLQITKEWVKEFGRKFRQY